MKKIYIPLLSMLFCVALVNAAHGQSNVTTTTGGTANQIPKFTSGTTIENSQITDDGTNVGIGTGNIIPTAKLEVSTPAVTNSRENVFRATVKDASGDFFELRNATILDGQFIPALWGHHETNTRQALHLIGEITTGRDIGTFPVMIFDARRAGGEVQTRPLFSWESFNIPRMTMLANGNLGIGTSNPQKHLHIKSDNPSCVTSIRLELELPSANNGCGPAHSTWDLNAQGNNNVFTITTPSLPQPAMTILGNGSVFLATQYPSVVTIASNSLATNLGGATKLDVRGSGRFTSTVNDKRFVEVGYNGTNGVINFESDTADDALLINYYSGRDVHIGTGATPSNVAIGGTLRIGPQTAIAPFHNYRLSVDGSIIAKEVHVNLTTWADFVYEPNHKRKNYLERELSFKKQKHLDGLKSGKDIITNGLDVSETIKGLTMNTEELWLDVIDLHKANQKLQDENSVLKKQLITLNERIERIETNNNKK